MSFREMPLHLAAQSNTIRTFCSFYPSSRLGNVANTIRCLAAARPKEPFVDIPFQHSPG